MSSNSDGFPSRMKIAINQLGSLAEVARRLSIVEATVRKWRDGESEPKVHYIDLLAKETGLSAAWLVTGEGEMLESDSRSIGEEPSVYNAQPKNHFIQALRVVEYELYGSERSIHPDKKIKLVELVNQLLEESGGVVESERLKQLIDLVT